MLIEFTGCSSAGKSTIVDSLEASGVGISGERVMLDIVGLGAAKGTPISLVVRELLALYGWLRFGPERRTFQNSARLALNSLPRVRWTEKANRIRNAWRHTFLFLVLQRHTNPSSVVLIDTGPMHTVHNFFIHTAANANPDDVLSYLELVPQPDLTVIVKADKDCLIERTLSRRHRRVANGDRSEATLFVDHSLEVFAVVESFLEGNGSLLRVRSDHPAGEIEALLNGTLVP